MNLIFEIYTFKIPVVSIGAILATFLPIIIIINAYNNDKEKFINRLTKIPVIIVIFIVLYKIIIEIMIKTEMFRESLEFLIFIIIPMFMLFLGSIFGDLIK